MVRLVEGQIVEDDEGGGVRRGLCRLLRFQSTINFLGFRVPLYWSCVAAIFAWLKFGAAGLVFVGVVAGEIEEGEKADDEKVDVSPGFFVLLGCLCKAFSAVAECVFLLSLNFPHGCVPATPKPPSYPREGRPVLGECRRHDLSRFPCR